MESQVTARLKELEEREAQVDIREATLEADHEIRDDKLERREKLVADLENKLGRKEADLAAYVGQLQAKVEAVGGGDADWWAKQLGKPLEAKGKPEEGA
jgi:hypothetical protein